MWNRKVFIRVVEILLCISCVVALRVTDDESRRVFHYLRNRSREWSLLNNVTWGTIGAAFATATCGGYVIVIAGLLVGAATGEIRGRKTELFFLGLGVILFGIVGALSLASIDSVPEDLVDNAAVLGALCLLTALVFIVDMLMKLPGAKKRHDGTQTNVAEKDFVKIPLATLNTEKEAKPDPIPPPKPDTKGSINTGFEGAAEAGAENEMNKRSTGDSDGEKVSKDVFEKERNRKFQDVGKQLREFTQQNFEEDRHRGSEERNNARREYFEGDRWSSGYFRRGDSWRNRPLDEVDTPPFPTNLDNRSSEPIFAKIVNPGIKIMRVERDWGNSLSQDNHRNSNSSQYDNVPTRMRQMSPGILKKLGHRDVSFNIPPNQRNFGNVEKRGDELERLEERFNALQSSIGTQTGSQRDVGSPSSPNDPGYVRHTANNWPYDMKTKTPGSSPEHDKH